MKVNAVYHVTDNGNHAVDHDSGGFIVSSEAVGLAVQNFLNNATASDISTFHRHLLYAFKDAWNKESQLPEAVEQP